jgi:anti-sigma B factor antagonist
MPGDFYVRTAEDGDGGTMVHVGGDIDTYTSPELRNLLGVLVRGGSTRLALDLSEVTFLDSSALAVLIATAKLCRAHGGSLRIQAATPETLRLLEITGLNRSLEADP